MTLKIQKIATNPHGRIARKACRRRKDRRARQHRPAGETRDPWAPGPLAVAAGCHTPDAFVSSDARGIAERERVESSEGFDCGFLRGLLITS